MSLIISMEGGTIGEEMMEHFNYDLNFPTPSAFVQQRTMIKLEAFQYLFKEFTSRYHTPKLIYLRQQSIQIVKIICIDIEELSSMSKIFILFLPLRCLDTIFTN